MMYPISTQLISSPSGSMHRPGCLWMCDPFCHPHHRLCVVCEIWWRPIRASIAWRQRLQRSLYRAMLSELLHPTPRKLQRVRFEQCWPAWSVASVVRPRPGPPIDKLASPIRGPTAANHCDEDRIDQCRLRCHGHGRWQQVIEDAALLNGQRRKIGCQKHAVEVLADGARLTRR